MINDPIRAFMCKIDWEDERFAPYDGNKLYGSVESLKREHSCWERCGIVEVTVSFSRIIYEGREPAWEDTKTAPAEGG